jgi:hypothetical protein
MEQPQSEGTSPSVVQGQSGRRVRRTRRRPGRESREVPRAPAIHGVDTMPDTAAHPQADADAQGHVSPRSAIMAADARSGPDTIPSPDGILRLTTAGAGAGAAANGDPDILDTFAR